MSEDLKFFKLTYSGRFTEISKENVLDSFNLYNIITIYSPFKKAMYVWIGKKAAQSLKRHIASIRHLFSRERPELYVLRNITIESGSEPENFFDLIKINSVTLREKLRNQEAKLMPVISEINRLKERADKLFIEKNFDKAIQISELVQDLAREIDDELLINDQQNFIEEARDKSKSIRIFSQIEDEALQVKNKIGELKKELELLTISNIINDFLIKYENYNLEGIQPVQDLVSISQDIQEKSQEEKIKIIQELSALDSQFNEFLKKNYLEKAKMQILKAKELLDKPKNNELVMRWKKNEEDFHSLKGEIKEKIQNQTRQVFDSLKERKISQSLTILNEIIEELERTIQT